MLENAICATVDKRDFFLQISNKNNQILNGISIIFITTRYALINII